MDKWLKPMVSLFIVIVVFSALARFLARGETLLEYAEKNPEIAYAAPASPSHSPLPAGSAMPSVMAMPTTTAMPSTMAMPSSMAIPSATAMPSTMAIPSPMDIPSMMAIPSNSPAPLTEEETEESVHYKDGFFYQPLTETVRTKITGISYPVTKTIAPLLSLPPVNVVEDDTPLAVSYDDLRYLRVLYYDFSGEVQAGELICNKGIAQDLVEIFYELYLNEYQFEKIRLIDEYNGDDTASMLDNNTSCFNYRVVDGTSRLSKHALGCAIDINPFYNPYVVFNKDGSKDTYISPAGSEIYADRSLNFPYKIDETDLCYRLFKAHGFTWGGNWNSSKDYQHFQKVVD